MKVKKDAEPKSVDSQRNEDLPKRTDAFPELMDFYNSYDDLTVTEEDKKAYEKFLKALSDENKELLENLPNAYIASFKNVGGLVMPIIAELHYEDGSTETRRIPAEIWRRNNEQVTKLFITEQPLTKITLDPNRETADSSVWNNTFPREIADKSVEMSFQKEKRGVKPGEPNPMRDEIKRMEQKVRDMLKKTEEKKAKEKEEDNSSDADLSIEEEKEATEGMIDEDFDPEGTEKADGGEEMESKADAKKKAKAERRAKKRAERKKKELQETE